MYTKLYYFSSKFSKFIEGKSPLLQQLASVSLLKVKSKMCPKLIELLSWNGPTVHVCCFMLARASTKTFVKPNPYSLDESKKQRKKKPSLAEKFFSRVNRQPRYHCTAAHTNPTNCACQLYNKNYASRNSKHFSCSVLHLNG